MNGLGLEGKVAVVTGAARGIGRSIAEALLGEGARVVLADINGPGVRETATVLGPSGHAVPKAADVTDPASVEELAEFVASTMGQIDIWINNAGITLRQPVIDVKLDEYEQVMAVNVRGVLLGSQAAARRMIPTRKGVIINVASIASDRAFPVRSVYGASKSAVILLTRSMASEWGPFGIRVNAISPGYIRTALTEWVDHDPAVRQSILSQVPMGRMGNVEELGKAVLFLASDLASYVSGHTLVVDGAWSSR